MRVQDIYGLLDALGIRVARETGDEIWSWCPGHKKRFGREDSKPTNWSLNARTGKHSCFACGYRGDVLTLITDVTGRSAWDAAEYVLKFGVNFDIEEDDKRPERYERPKVSESQLSVYVPPPKKALRARGVSAESCGHYGVLWDDKTARWILPIRHPDGTLLGWQEKGKDYFKNVPGKLRKKETLFGINVAEAGKPFILVESPLDCVRLFTVGYGNAVASYGSVVSDEQLNLILEYTDDLVLALDNDKAGITTMKDIKKRWLRRFNLAFLYYGHTDAKDPGDMEEEDIHYAIDNALSILAVRL